MVFLSRLKMCFASLFLVTACSNIVPTRTESSTDAVYAIAIQSGNKQTGNSGSVLPNSLVVVVTDKANGKVASNASVTWAIPSGGANFVSSYTHTSVNGEAPASISLNATPGITTVTATVSTGDSVTFTETGVLGVPYAANCLISGTSPTEPDGVANSTVTITLKDSSNNAVVGTVPTFTATGTNNTYGVCSASSSTGVSTCLLSSTTAETKILSLASPVAKVGGTAVFALGSASGATSTITGTGPVVSDGVASSTVSITLKDATGLPILGVVPTFSATDTGTTNAIGSCSLTNASGVSTCTLKSLHAETKTLSITAPVSLSGGTTVFIAGAPAVAHSSITGTGPTENDGVATSTISIVLQDANSNPVAGTIPTFSATNTGGSNVNGVCSSSDVSGRSTCTLASNAAETKTLSLVTPVSLAGGLVVFGPGPVSAAKSSIIGTGPVVADGIVTSTITITLHDAANTPVSGRTPTFSATDTSAKNAYGSCSPSNVSGVSNCTLSSTYAETKTLTMTSPVNLVGGTVVFTAGAASTVTSTISGTGSVVADGVATSSVAITLLDVNSNPVSAVTPTFTATNTGNTNNYGVCSNSNASGVSTCTLNSTKAEVKTLVIATPINKSGGNVTFVHGSASVSTSTITGSGPVPPDGVSTSTISILLKDASGNPVDAVTPTFNATNTGASNAYGACSATSLAGTSTCTLKSSNTETKTLSLVTPIAMSGGTVVFVAGAASAVNSSIAGTSSVVANGIATSTVTITLKDSGNLAILGTTPTFTATNTNNGNTYGACSATNGSGVSTCSLSSTKAELKTLSISSPINLAGGTVTFTAGTISSANSQITGTSSIVANGTATSTVTIVLYDVNNNAVAGTTPVFSATDTGATNAYGGCSVSNAAGTSTCTLSSTKAEAKTLSIATPVSKSGGSVSFIAGAAVAVNSSIAGTGPVTSNGVASSLVTITLRDANSNPVPGTTPSFTATDSTATNVYGACSASNSSGVSTCTLKSSFAETKTLSVATPVSFSGGTVVFN